MIPNSAALSRRSLLRGSALLAAGAAFSPGPAFAAFKLAAPSMESRFPTIAKMIEGYVEQRKVPGMLATVALGSGAPGTIARGVEAFDDPDAMGLDSLYRLYSMTKPVTGMATMMLIDEGKLRLDQPLSDILPKFAKMQVQVTPDGSITDLRPAKSAITIRHLLTHTAGLGYTIVQKGPIKKAYEDAGLVPGLVTKLPIPGLSRGTAVSEPRTLRRWIWPRCRWSMSRARGGAIRSGSTCWAG